MSGEIIFHHYWTSPFSEKVRIAFGIKGLSWRSVEVPTMLPKPDLVPLTGGYRKTPVMQIGADIYCDTAIILRELDRRFPTASLLPGGRGLARALGFWTDRAWFMATVPIIFGALGDMIPEAFKKDREQMSGGVFSTDQMKAAAPLMRDQWRAHAAFLEDTLADDRNFLGGAAPSLTDAHAYMNVWFLSNFLKPAAEALLLEFPAVRAWADRVAAIGHGRHAPMEAQEALAVARASTPATLEQVDPHDPHGRRPGTRVKIMADDYGRDPVEGHLVASDAQTIAIRRHTPETGDVVVHFPKAGFWIMPA